MIRIIPEEGLNSLPGKVFLEFDGTELEGEFSLGYDLGSHTSYVLYTTIMPIIIESNLQENLNKINICVEDVLFLSNKQPVYSCDDAELVILDIEESQP